MLIYKSCDHFSNINTRKTKKISQWNEKMLTKQRILDRYVPFPDGIQRSLGAVFEVQFR